MSGKHNHFWSGIYPTENEDLSLLDEGKEEKILGEI
jgi:hypothetical protein